jgi:chromosome segregation ATPase
MKDALRLHREEICSLKEKVKEAHSADREARENLQYSKDAAKECAAQVEEQKGLLQKEIAQLNDWESREHEASSRLAEMESAIEQAKAELQDKKSAFARKQEHISDLEARARELDVNNLRYERESELLTREKRETQERVDRVKQDLKQGEEHRQRREQELSEREQQVLKVERDLEGRMREAADRIAILQPANAEVKLELNAQRQDMEDQFKKQRHDLMRQAAEQQDRHRRSSNTDKENRHLRQTVQQNKKWLWDLEGNIDKERTSGNFLTPGEYLRMAEDELMENDLPLQCSELKSKNTNLEFEQKKLLEFADVLMQQLPQLLPPTVLQRTLAEIEALEETLVARSRASLNTSGEPAQEPVP